MENDKIKNIISSLTLSLKSKSNPSASFFAKLSQDIEASDGVITEDLKKSLRSIASMSQYGNFDYEDDKSLSDLIDLVSST